MWNYNVVEQIRFVLVSFLDAISFCGGFTMHFQQASTPNLLIYDPLFPKKTTLLPKIKIMWKWGVLRKSVDTFLKEAYSRVLLFPFSCSVKLQSEDAGYQSTRT